MKRSSRTLLGRGWSYLAASLIAFGVVAVFGASIAAAQGTNEPGGEQPGSEQPDPGPPPRNDSRPPGDDERGKETIKYLSFTNYPLLQALQWIAGEYSKSLVAGPSIGGKVTLTLQDVKLDDALAAMLGTNGYAIQMQGKVMVIVPKSEPVVAPITKTYVFEQIYDVDRIAKEFALLASGKAKILANDDSKIIFIEDQPSSFKLLDTYYELLLASPPEGKPDEKKEELDPVEKELLRLPQEVERLEPAIKQIINPSGATESKYSVVDERERLILIEARKSRMDVVRRYLEELRKGGNVYEPPSERIETRVYVLQQPVDEIATDLRKFLSANPKADIIVNARANSLIVRDVATQFATLERFVRELDTEPQQVHIAATFIESSITADEDANFNLAAAINVAGGSVNWRYLSPNSTTGPSTANVPSTSYVLGFSRGTDIDVALGLLTKRSNTNVLSRPKVVVANNKEAVIKVGQEIPYVSGLSTAGGSTTVDFKDVTLTLTVKPHIEPNNRIRLEIDIKIIDQVGTVTGGTDIDGSPILSNRSIQTEVWVQDGDSLILGGFYQDTDTDSENKIPVLGDLPVLGALFTSTGNRYRKNDLLFIITPRIVTAAATTRTGIMKDGRMLKPRIRLRIHRPPWLNDPSVERLAARGGN